MKIEFIPREKQRSEYDWADISTKGLRIGKARCLIDGTTLTIYSINIYPEFAGKGFGRRFVDYCKSRFTTVIADRVRPTAIGFWETMGFHDAHDGSWVYSAR